MRGLVRHIYVIIGSRNGLVPNFHRRQAIIWTNDNLEAGKYHSVNYLQNTNISIKRMHLKMRLQNVSIQMDAVVSFVVSLDSGQAT